MEFAPYGIQRMHQVVAAGASIVYSDYYDTKTFKMYLSGNRLQRQWLIMAARELKLMPTTEGGLDYRLNMTHAMDGYPGVEHTMPVWPAFNDVVELFKTSGTTNTPT